jgi:uncharacterized flavoprotein (TIGR03862 family)
VGGGACALMLGCELNTGKYEVSIYEGNAAPGRKFLVAGEGGLNLTHSESAAAFIQRYTPPAFLEEHFKHFSNTNLVNWLQQLGVETYTGSSGRVFPKKGVKPVEVLNAILARVRQNGVSIHTRHVWKGFSENKQLLLEHEGQIRGIKSDLVIFCLGGASWPVTGSRGDWGNYFKEQGIRVLPFEASNCAVTINWPAELIPLMEGKALKNCVISCGGAAQAGEVVITAQGMEGSGLYPLSPQIRQQLRQSGQAELNIDLKPAVSREALLKKLEKPQGRKTYSRHVADQLNLDPLQMNLLKWQLSKTHFLEAQQLVAAIKNLRLYITGRDVVDNAISTVGGIPLQELDEHFELKNLPGHFAIGEMLDFDAPTGGYLLQAAFTMGNSLAQFLNNK